MKQLSELIQEKNQKTSRFALILMYTISGEAGAEFGQELQESGWFEKVDDQSTYGAPARYGHQIENIKETVDECLSNCEHRPHAGDTLLYFYPDENPDGDGKGMTLQRLTYSSEKHKFEQD